MIKKRNLFITASIFLLLINACKPTELLTVTVMGESEIGVTTSNSAVIKGNVLEIGENMQAYGHVWGENENPTISNFKSEHTNKLVGTFTDTLKNLSPETEYYVRPYSKGGEEIIYGDDIIFTTIKLTVPASIITYNASDISYTTANSGGNITKEGESPITLRGVCWSTLENPTIDDFTTEDGSNTGNFTSNLTGLTDNTTYYIRAYAVNSEGTHYGQEESLKTLNGLPILTTIDVSDITNISANCSGSVQHEGISNVSVRGICWSSAQNPTIDNNFTTVGAGIGSFTSSLSGLTELTSYYVRAYATNSVGTEYGNELSFNTITLPTIITNTISNITHTTANSGGNITSDGGAIITARGVCWSTNTNPTLSDNYSTDNSGLGTFISSIDGLTGGTNYFVRAYATNITGTTYGNEQVFTTSETPLAIGDFYQGGVIFHIDETGEHGLVCDINNLPSSEWGCNGWSLPGAEGSDIGTGAQNTIDIEAACSTEGTAADRCANLSLNGYDDWFLPAWKTLGQMSNNRDAINVTAIENGGTSLGDGGDYWSSTEYGGSNASFWIMGCCMANNPKTGIKAIRAVRAF